MSGANAAARHGWVAESPASNWRTKLLNWSLSCAALLATVAFPVISAQALPFSPPEGLMAMVVAYGMLVAGALMRRLDHRVRSMLLLVALGGVAVLGFMRVGFQVGPGLGCALTVVLSGLLLGRRALIIAFVITLLSILLIGVQQST